MNYWFFSEILPLAPEKFLFNGPATFMPHLSVLTSLVGFVVTRSGSKHFRRVAHGRDSIENNQSLLPPTLLGNLFEKNSSEERETRGHFLDCGHTTLQIQTSRGHASRGGHLSAQGNWMR